MNCEQCGCPLTAYNTDPTKGPLARCRGCMNAMVEVFQSVYNFDPDLPIDALQQSPESDSPVPSGPEVELSIESHYIGPRRPPTSRGPQAPS